MKIKIIQPFVLLSLSVISGLLFFLSCSDNSSPGASNNDAVNREFVSGDMGIGASFTHVFLSAKSIPYYCRYHGAKGGTGMSGAITVSDGGTPNLITVSISSSSLPDLSIDVGDTVTWTNNHTTTHTVESDN